MERDSDDEEDDAMDGVDGDAAVSSGGTGRDDDEGDVMMTDGIADGAVAGNSRVRAPPSSLLIIARTASSWPGEGRGGAGALITPSPS